MDTPVTQLLGVLVSKVIGTNSAGRPLVLGENGLPRQAVVAWTAGDPVDWSACAGLRAVVAYEEGDPDRPIILGLLDPPPALASSSSAQNKPETVHLESKRELVIECGKAKIALRADGRIEIRGGHLVSRSTGPNKIKGSSVHIN